MYAWKNQVETPVWLNGLDTYNMCVGGRESKEDGGMRLGGGKFLYLHVIVCIIV